MNNRSLLAGLSGQSEMFQCGIFRYEHSGNRLMRENLMNFWSLYLLKCLLVLKKVVCVIVSLDMLQEWVCLAKPTQINIKCFLMNLFKSDLKFDLKPNVFDDLGCCNVLFKSTNVVYEGYHAFFPYIAVDSLHSP